MNKRIKELLTKAPKSRTDMRHHNGRNFRMSWLRFAKPVPQRKRCAYGDDTCPCQDGDMCHYEGPNPMTPPSDLTPT